MPRTARLLIDGGTYHVITRGDNRQAIFHDQRDYERYLRLLGEYKRDCSLNIYHFALMPNHVHLIVHVQEGRNLSQAMLGLNLSYALSYRKRYAYHGHLWQGRFKSLLVDRDEYLLACGRYVELNPVRAGLVRAPNKYPWSSYHAYAYGAPNPIVDLNPLYEAMGNTPARRQERYQRLVLDDLRRPADSRLTTAHVALGSPTFLRSLECRFGIRMARRPRGRPSRTAESANEK